MKVFTKLLLLSKKILLTGIFFSVSSDFWIF